MQNKINSELNSVKDDSFNLRETLKKYTYHWKWFVLSTLVALTCAFIYLKNATNQYKVSSTILINTSDNEGGSASENIAFRDIEFIDGPKNSLETEMGILKSITLIERVVKELKLNETYFIKKNFTSSEVYQGQVPFIMNYFLNDSISTQLDTIFSITSKSKTDYVLSDSNGKPINEGVFGERTSCEFGDLIVTPKTIDDVALGQEILVKISPIQDVAINLKDRIKIAPESKKSNLLILWLQDPVRLKAKAVLDSLVSFYNKEAIAFKEQIALNTDEFIDNRIDDISIELTGFDRGVERYKKVNKLSDINSEEGLVLASNAGVANKIVELTSQIKLIDYVTDYMKTNKDDLIPANLGLMNESTSQNTINYNNLLLERNRLSGSASSENPIIANLNDQIESLRESIDQSLVNIRSSLSFSLNEARQEERKLASKISASPKIEREIRDIQRQQEIFETLYLYLLQKKEENSISLAVTTSNAKIIDRAYGSVAPVSPNKMLVLAGAMLLGLLLPVLIIFIQSLLDNKIHYQEEVEAVIKAPILGYIPTSKSKKNIAAIAFDKERSNLSESFRLLRTNVNFMLDANQKEGKSIFITSTIGGEGKTFIAINLATALALLDKKVLLIEADIRKPRMTAYLGTKHDKGLTHFLSDNTLPIPDVIEHHEETKLDILNAGAIPPNPSELITNGHFDKILAYGKVNYDYIIVDTAPVNLAPDTLLLGHLADLFVYVIRADFLNKRMLNIPKNLFENKRLPNMAILLNDMNYEKNGYDSVYTYGEVVGKNTWWKRLLPLKY